MKRWRDFGDFSAQDPHGKPLVHTEPHSVTCSLRSAATSIDTPASETPNSAAAARTELNRTTAE
ncbi:hypothetical protein A5641_25785 [Mycobacterium sp. 1554424.7]|nr:hypothetical protein A5641_25785 [Mycobacterium sp. 1554424.7]